MDTDCSEASSSGIENQKQIHHPHFILPHHGRNRRRVRLWRHDRDLPRIYESEEGHNPRHNLAHHRSRDGHFNCVGSSVGIQESQVLVQGDQESAQRLVAQTIQSGTAGASMALAVLVAFLANKESNGGFLGLPLSIPGSHIPVPTGIAYGLGRVYCITMLANLNSRKTGKTWSGWRMSSGANLETRGERGNQERSEGRDEYGGIHVHRTAVVHIDTPQELSTDTFKTNGLPDDSSAIEIEITVNNSASYSSKKKQHLFAA
ncbi:hypothetical protein B0H14DRAFT_3136624 [Mycena olivaceomarginata]|nr:hypothetical protein B0H14DRAFT_3136624 [Mycena olivaceomarginata]